jgi:hypothetical protein
MNNPHQVADGSVPLAASDAPGPRRGQTQAAPGAGAILLMGALVALAGGVWTLQTARETSMSIVNDPSIIALCVNGLAAVLLPLAMWKLLKTRGVIGGLVTSFLWVGVASFLLNASMEANAAESSRRWASERAVRDVEQICSGKKTHDARAKAFDPAATEHNLVVVRSSALPSTAPHIRSAQSLRIEDADLVACAQEVEETVETCTYDGYRKMARARVDTTVRFLSIKTGEEIWRTTLVGSPPRACQDNEKFLGTSMRGTIRGNPRDPVVAYNEHFLSKR